MEKKTLFPVISMPDIYNPTRTEENRYKQSVKFDFETGDFVRTGGNDMQVCDGKTAYVQWCIKTVSTERLAHLSYGTDIGIELYNALQSGNRSTAQSLLTRTITEALSVNSHTEYVRNFVYEWAGDYLFCSFVIKGKGLEEQSIKVQYRV